MFTKHTTARRVFSSILATLLMLAGLLATAGAANATPIVIGGNPGGGSAGGGSATGGGSNGSPGAIPFGWGHTQYTSIAHWNNGSQRVDRSRVDYPSDLGVRLNVIPGGYKDGQKSFRGAGTPCLNSNTGGVVKNLSLATGDRVSEMALGVRYAEQIHWNGRGPTGMRLGFKAAEVKNWNKYNLDGITKSTFGCVGSDQAVATNSWCATKVHSPQIIGPYGKGTNAPTEATAHHSPGSFESTGTQTVLSNFGAVYNNGSWRPTKNVRIKRTWDTNNGKWVNKSKLLLSGQKITDPDVRAAIIRGTPRGLCGGMKEYFTDASPDKNGLSVGLYKAQALGDQVVCSTYQVGKFVITKLQDDATGKDKVIYVARNFSPSNGCDKPLPVKVVSATMVTCNLATNTYQADVSGVPGSIYNPATDFTNMNDNCVPPPLEGSTVNANFFCQFNPNSDNNVTVKQADPSGVSHTYGNGATVLANGQPVKVTVAAPTNIYEGRQEVDGNGNPTGNVVSTGNVPNGMTNFQTRYMVQEGSTPYPAGYGVASSDPVKSNRALDNATDYPGGTNSSGWDNGATFRFYKASSPKGISSTTIAPFKVDVIRSFTYNRMTQTSVLDSSGHIVQDGPMVLTPTTGECGNSTTVKLVAVGSRNTN